MSRLLVIEDEEVILKALTRFLERKQFEVVAATTVQAAMAADPQRFDLILADLRLPGAEGTDIIPHAGNVPVVIMTSHASVRSAVAAMRNGAIDYIAKPFDHDELLLVIERALAQNRLRAQNHALKLELQRVCGPDDLLGVSGLDQVVADIDASSGNARALLLHGSRGTGRELIARELHQRGERSDAPLLIHDVPDPNTAGAQQREVPLQSAHNGTLVIRHPEWLGSEEQDTVAQSLTASLTGGKQAQRALNLHVIAISNHSLTTLRAEQAFSPTLAELLDGQEHRVPTLAERGTAISGLAERLLEHLGIRHQRTGLRFTADAIAAMQAYAWPGNLFELMAAVERGVLTTRAKHVDASHIGLSLPGEGREQDASDLRHRDLSLEEYFRYFVLRYQASLSETELASRLGISRKALWERRQKLGLMRESLQD